MDSVVDQFVISNGATFGVASEAASIFTEETLEVKENPQGVVEWTPDDVFWTSHYVDPNAWPWWPFGLFKLYL